MMVAASENSCSRFSSSVHSSLTVTRSIIARDAKELFRTDVAIKPLLQANFVTWAHGITKDLPKMNETRR